MNIVDIFLYNFKDKCVNMTVVYAKFYVLSSNFG